MKSRSRDGLAAKGLLQINKAWNHVTQRRIGQWGCFKPNPGTQHIWKKIKYRENQTITSLMKILAKNIDVGTKHERRDLTDSKHVR